MTNNPYVVGQWVRGSKFYGRTFLIDEILRGHRNWLWLLGTRRIGKTSLLKQVEHLAVENEDLGYFPLFWDFQGSESPAELHLGFGDSLLDAEERLEALGIAPDAVEADDLFRSLGKLRRKLRAKGKRVLLLCDEVEELIKLNEKDPSLLRKLRRAFQSQEDVRSVLASTIRLWALADERGDTSPFLHGFSPPLYIHNLADDEARALILQANLPFDSQPRVVADEVDAIHRHCDNHPYLIQLLCKRHLELGNLDEAIEQVATDPMVSFFFSVDFEMLSDVEREILRVIGEQDDATTDSIMDRMVTDQGTLGGSLHRLQHLGYIRKAEHGRFVLLNYFFKRWYAEQDEASSSGRCTGCGAELGPGSSPRGLCPSCLLQLGMTGASDDANGAALGDTQVFGSQSEVLDGRYRLLERIGEGATGVVYKAHDPMLRTEIAIKVLRPQYTRQEDLLERVRREVLLARDISHPNVVKIYHLGEFDGKKYVTMQWMNGPTLAKLIESEAPFSAERVVALGEKLAGALAAAHDLRVLHRDIKPQNILIDDRGEPHVTDFGLARLVGDPGVTCDGMFVGTPAYASPEQIGSQELDERSDIYSLGVVLFEMATGARPFVGASAPEVLRMHVQAPAPDPGALSPQDDPALSAIIRRCLEKSPDRRFQSASDLRVALNSCGGDATLPVGR